MNLTTATPVEIDTVLARIYGDTWTVRATLYSLSDSLLRQVGAKYNYYNRSFDMTPAQGREKAAEMLAGDAMTAWDRRNLQANVDKMTAQYDRLAALAAEQAPLDAEYTRRGGWTRAYLVQGNNGHVHSSMNCSTCNKGDQPTQFVWMVDYSGKDEAEIVGDAGERACTVCYPSAPVDTLNRPTRMFGPDEIAAQQAREERAAAKVARLATKIAKGLTADGSEFVVEMVEPNAGGHERNAEGQSVYVYKDRPRREHFKTEQAAVQWVVQYTVWGEGNDRYDYMKPGFDQVIAAVAEKHGKTVEQVQAEIDVKVAAKRKRDGR